MGVVGGALVLIVSTFMIYIEQSKKAAISSVSPVSVNEGKTHEYIKYLSDKVAQVAKEIEEK